jgi:hypothetical protein
MSSKSGKKIPLDGPSTTSASYDKGHIKSKTLERDSASEWRLKLERKSFLTSKLLNWFCPMDISNPCQS